MANFNKVILIGNLTADPELRYTPSGAAVADLRLAVNNDFTSKDGEKRKDTVYVDVVVWQRQAENCSQYLSKGRSVMIEGKLKLDTWENKEGEKRSKLRVVASNVQFLGGQRDRPDNKKDVAEHDGAPEQPSQSNENIGEDDIPF